MNYHGFAVPVKGWLIDARISAGEFAKRLGQGRENRTLSQMLVQQNLVDSHDTQRLASAIKNRATHPDYLNADWFDYDEGSRVTARHPDYQTGKPDAEGRRIWKMVALFQATYPGAPMIYYGTEIGLHGADDPDDRMPAPWHDPDKEMLECYRAVIELRNTHEALRRGGFRVIETHNVAQVFVFERNFKGEKIIIALNRGLEDFALGDDLASLQLAYSTATEATQRQLPYLSASVYIEKSEATD
jgi:glycosidase